jgi:hypothetical protein
VLKLNVRSGQSVLKLNVINMPKGKQINAKNTEVVRDVLNMGVIKVQNAKQISV